MHTNLKINPNKLLIFHELRRRRIYVGTLTYDTLNKIYQLTYDGDYVVAKNAIPMGPELSLFKTVHTSQDLFAAFIDRIPERENPAYPDYCKMQGISVDEENPIILLGAIGRRGPSTFVFEKTYLHDFSAENIIQLRKTLDITQHDLAAAFGISKVTLQKIEAGISHDPRTIQLFQIYCTFPEVAIWQLRQTGVTVHSTVLNKLLKFFKKDLTL